MLTHPQVQRYSVEAGLRNIMIAENEIVLTYLLQLMAERGILDKLAFKGGTCLRKMFIGSGGRFSTDLDFTRVEEHDHEEVILVMMEAFDHPFHGIQFSVPDDSYYETQDGLSWGVNPVYAHDWNPSGQSEIKLQISRREVPTLPHVAELSMHAELFPAPAFPVRGHYLPCPARDRRREAPGLFSALLLHESSIVSSSVLTIELILDQPLIRWFAVLMLWQTGDVVPIRKLSWRSSTNAVVIPLDWDDLRSAGPEESQFDRYRPSRGRLNMKDFAFAEGAISRAASMASRWPFHTSARSRDVDNASRRSTGQPKLLVSGSNRSCCA